MRSKLSSGYWKKKSSVLLALAMVASLTIQPVNVRAAVATTVKATAITLNVEDNLQVLLVGNSYDLEYTLSPKKSTEKVTFKSSNTAVATVSKSGVITPKKQGGVTLVATTQSGKKVSKRVLVVTKAYTTAYQTTLDKMLTASNIKKVILKDTKYAKKYVIQKGNYTSKTLYVNAPKSDVKNFGKFKMINIVDIAQNTWTEGAIGNAFKITDSNAHFVVSPLAQVSSINVASDHGQVAIDANGSVGTVNVTGAQSTVSLGAGSNSVVRELRVTSTDAKVTVVADGTIDKIVLDSKAELEIKGSSAGVAVEVTAKAAGASVQSAVPVTASVAAQATFVLEKGAEDSQLSTASSSVGISVENNTTAKVVVTNEETMKTEDVAAGTTQDVTPVPGPITGGGTIGGGTGTDTTTTTTTKTVTGVNSGTSATYDLTVPITSLKSATVKVTNTSDYAISSDVLTYVVKLLSMDAFYVDLWSNMSSITSKVGVDGKDVVATGVGATKTVTFDGKTFNVTVNSTSVVVTKVPGTVTYTLSKSSDGKVLTINSTGNNNIAGLVSFVITY